MILTSVRKELRSVLLLNAVLLIQNISKSYFKDERRMIQGRVIHVYYAHKGTYVQISFQRFDMILIVHAYYGYSNIRYNYIMTVDQYFKT